MTWRHIYLLQIATLLIVAAVILPDLYRDGGPWWLAAAVALIVLGILYTIWPRRYRHLYLLVQAVLVTGLTVFDTTGMVLGFSLSASALLLFPGRVGVLWITGLVLATGAVLVYQDGWLDGLVMSLAFAAGYYSFGFAYYARDQAETARREGQALLADLQEAHRQLQAYAEQVEELAVAEERNRLAREMHDTLGHRLTVAAVQLEGAQRLIPTEPEQASRMVGTVREQVREALEELRRTVATLRTPLEADVSLTRALARVAGDFEEATGLAVHLTLPDDLPPLPDTHRLAIYRAAQEALTNVQRHAHAQTVWLELALQGDAMTLLVSDDGVGSPPAAETRGFGLRGLQERAAQLGGDLTLEARPSGGAQLAFRLPLPAEETDG
jgi:signal transduction histidine kinase